MSSKGFRVLVLSYYAAMSCFCYDFGAIPLLGPENRQHDEYVCKGAIRRRAQHNVPTRVDHRDSDARVPSILCVYMFMYMFVHISIYLSLYIHIYAYVYIYIYIYIVYMYVRTYVRTYVCMYVCMYVYITQGGAPSC